jgi:8-oxo-dGTP diphosphatase
VRPEDAVARLPVPARRAAYRVAHAGLRVWWFVRRPDTRGVKCLLRHEGRVLFIRHTYGDRRVWELPGGGIARGETPEQAAAREAREELGVVVAWHPVTVVEIRDHKLTRLHVFTADLPGSGASDPAVRDRSSAIALTIDPGEIAEARWAAPDDPPRPLSPSTAAILEI